MQMIRDRTGRFTERPHYETTQLEVECERLVCEYLVEKHGRVIWPISTDDLTVLLEQHVEKLDLYADLVEEGADVEGVTDFFPGRRPQVRISGTLSATASSRNRLRTTLTHELGHVRFHAFLYELKGRPRPLRFHQLDSVGCGISLEKEFVVERRRSALRLKQREEGAADEDLRINVVPGRFVDDSETDAFLHQEGVDKNCLKTNLDKHIEHVKQSGVRDAIKLQKLWRVRRTIQIKTFIMVLLIIDELDGAEDEPIDDQLIPAGRCELHRPPNQLDPPASLAGHRHSGVYNPLARRAGQTRSRARDARGGSLPGLMAPSLRSG